MIHRQSPDAIQNHPKLLGHKKLIDNHLKLGFLHDFQCVPAPCSTNMRGAGTCYTWT